MSLAAASLLGDLGSAGDAVSLLPLLLLFEPSRCRIEGRATSDNRLPILLICFHADFEADDDDEDVGVCASGSDGGEEESNLESGDTHPALPLELFTSESPPLFSMLTLG